MAARAQSYLRMCSPESTLESDFCYVSSAPGSTPVDPRSRNEVIRILADHNHQLRGWIGAASVAWRTGRRNLKKYAQNAVRVGNSAAQVCESCKIRKSKECVPFSFGIACQFAFLLGSQFPDDLANYLMTPSDYGKSQYNDPVACADACLVLAMRNGRTPKGWDELIENQFRKRFKRHHLAKSFVLYMSLIDAARNCDWDSLPSLVDQADGHYLARKSDVAYRNFGVVDGACMYNNVRIDYRLGTILKWAFRDSPRKMKKFGTIHRWPLK